MDPLLVDEEAPRIHILLAIEVSYMATPVTAPMVGKVLQVQCKVGDKVQEDDVILLLEAMKMEIPVVAPISGTVKELKVSPGDTVESDTVLAVIE